MERRFLMGLRSFLIAGVMSALMGTVGTIAAAEQVRQPILIPGIQEPDEMRVEPFPAIELTAPERELADAMKNFSKVDLPELLPALNRILAKYPDFADGYVFRLGAFCERNERHAAMSDINNALKFMSSSRSIAAREAPAGLLSMRAKLAYADGDYITAMNDLESAVRADLRKATAFANSKAVKPEKIASVCVWTEPDMEALVQRFPTDYRSYLFRGLYYNFYTSFSDGGALRDRALGDFRRAAQIDASSALPHYFNAQAIGWSLSKQMSMSDDQLTALYRAQMDELNKALARDPDLRPALSDRAGSYFSLRQFPAAIADYNRVIALDPNDAAIYNDRGLAKMQLGQIHDAISDFAKAIEKKPRKSMESSTSYENRADAYMKTRQWDPAISDLTTAMSLKVGRAVLLMNIDQFRAIYPEYKSASNEDIARKLHQTFYPNLKFEGFAKDFFTQRGLISFLIAELYLKRADAYLKKGNWHRASIEFQRVINGFTDYVDAVDRWREIGQTAEARNYIDMKTFDDSRKDSIRVWIKIAKDVPPWVVRQGGEPYALQQFELNCATRQIRTVSSANYDASGDLVGSREGGRWASIIPDTVGETLYSGACRAN
jgi:tetratricopeptide (TPR) repeat protein